jgi:16S rRNA (guanine527-N7)-methyltransferase
MQTDIDMMGTYLPELPEEQIEQLKKYYEDLIYFNSKVNLVSSSTAPYAARQHFADCVFGLKLAQQHSKLTDTVYDFGSGNGFPGLVLAIINRDVGVCLVERDVRKAEFLKHVAANLKLDNVTVFASGIEKLEKNSITHGITRALGSISKVLIQVNSLFVKGGTLFHFKAENWPTEIANCPTQLFTTWDIQSIGNYMLPESSVERFIISSKRL